jgi:hypothetical protein
MHSRADCGSIVFNLFSLLVAYSIGPIYQSLLILSFIQYGGDARQLFSMLVDVTPTFLGIFSGQGFVAVPADHVNH